jgi:hypothetical protein
MSAITRDCAAARARLRERSTRGSAPPGMPVNSDTGRNIRPSSCTRRGSLGTAAPPTAEPPCSAQTQRPGSRLAAGSRRPRQPGCPRKPPTRPPITPDAPVTPERQRSLSRSRQTCLRRLCPTVSAALAHDRGRPAPSAAGSLAREGLGEGLSDEARCPKMSILGCTSRERPPISRPPHGRHALKPLFPLPSLTAPS